MSSLLVFIAITIDSSSIITTFPLVSRCFMSGPSGSRMSCCATSVFNLRKLAVIVHKFRELLPVCNGFEPLNRRLIGFDRIIFEFKHSQMTLL